VDNPQALVNADARVQLEGLFAGLGNQGKELFEQMLATLRNALNSSLTEVFFVFMCASAVALVVNLFLKGIPGHRPRRDMRAEKTKD